MSYHDPIADLLTRIRNAKTATHRYVDINVSKLKLGILKVLKEQGFIQNFLVNEEKRKVRIFLKYGPARFSVIQGLQTISSPGARRYVSYEQIPHILGGVGLAILSTSKGIIDGHTARKEKVGGELLCKVW